MKRIFKGSILTLLFLPSIALASVQITEVMYDLPGGDTGREWIEITNTGSESVDITKYKLAEGTTNHGFTSVSGSMILAPNASAILADNPEKFLADWPAFAGVLINTVFSLSNTGETLSVKNTSGAVEDTLSYTSGMGAAGDGGTLSRSGSTYTPAMPSPGAYPGPLMSVPKVEKPAPVKTAAKTSAKSKTSKASKGSQTAAVASEDTFDPDTQNSPETLPMSLWVTGLVAIIGLGVTGTVYARLGAKKPMPEAETNAQKEEFQIVDSE